MGYIVFLLLVLVWGFGIRSWWRLERRGVAVFVGLGVPGSIVAMTAAISIAVNCMFAGPSCDTGTADVLALTGLVTFGGSIITAIVGIVRSVRSRRQSDTAVTASL